MKNKTILFAASVLVYVLAACGGSEKATTETTAATETNEVAKTEEKAAAHPGKAVYMTYCMTCHMKEGEGVPNLNPPLTDKEWVEGDKTRLINIVLKGLQGEIEVAGETWNGVMASHSFLNDQQIADVLSYIRQSFGNNAEAITAEEVAAVRNSN